jgi:hypothetical protein
MRPVRAGALRHELYQSSHGARARARRRVRRDRSHGRVRARRPASTEKAQLAAGIVEGRLHLLAYALAASACGMTFVDGEVPASIGEGLDGLLFTCVGVPEYRFGCRRETRRADRGAGGGNRGSWTRAFDPSKD